MCEITTIFKFHVCVKSQKLLGKFKVDSQIPKILKRILRPCKTKNFPAVPQRFPTKKLNTVAIYGHGCNEAYG